MKKKIEFDYSALRNKIRSKGFTISTLANNIGCSEGQLCHKLNNHFGFTQEEITSICKALDVSVIDIGIYFFKRKCEITQGE